MFQQICIDAGHVSENTLYWSELYKYQQNISCQWCIVCTRDSIFQATEEQMKLMEYQVKLEEKYRKTFMDLSLSDTIYQVRSVTHSTVLAFTVDWGRLTDHLPLP